jgi:hypothetical protein
MILVRCACILIGISVLFAAPFLLLPDSPTGAPREDWTVLAGCIGLLVCTSGFFFVGLAGRRLHRSLRLRVIAVALLSAPVVGGIWLLLDGKHFDALWEIGTVLTFTITLLLAVLSNVGQRRSYRSMRPRELIDPSQP